MLKMIPYPAGVLSVVRCLLVLVFTFSSLYFVFGDEGAPGGGLFAVFVIYFTALAAGDLIGKTGLPPLLGMLCTGLIFRNIPWLGERIGERVNGNASNIIRLAALALILTRAGLSFDLEALRRLATVVLRLAILPCLLEAATVFGLGIWMLDLTPIWSAMLGFVVSPISPAVVVPGLLALQEQGYGVATGIPTMVVAAAPLDDVLSIAGFGIFLGLAQSQSASNQGHELWFDLARAPLEVGLGFIAGFVGAGMLKLTAEKQQGDEKSEGGLISTGLFLGMVVVLAFGFKRAGFSGASALSVLVVSVCITRFWSPSAVKATSQKLVLVWNYVAQPLLFGLVGSSVDFSSLSPGILGMGAVILLTGLSVRCAVAFAAVGGRRLLWQERLFTALAWLPKATVQAAIGGIALDEAAASEQERKMGTDILAIAVLAILSTAPVGAVAISLLGPRLLTLSKGNGQDTEQASLDEANSVNCTNGEWVKEACAGEDAANRVNCTSDEWVKEECAGEQQLPRQIQGQGRRRGHCCGLVQSMFFVSPAR